MGRTFRIVPNSLSFCLTEADLSLLSYHVLAYTTLNMLAGAQRYICAFFGRLLKSSLFGCSNRRKNEPHSFNTPFLLVFPFFSGLASPSSGIAALFRKFLLDSWLIMPTLPPAPNSRVSGRLQPSLCSSCLVKFIIGFTTSLRRDPQARLKGFPTQISSTPLIRSFHPPTLGTRLMSHDSGARKGLKASKLRGWTCFSASIVSGSSAYTTSTYDFVVDTLLQRPVMLISSIDQFCIR